MLAVRIAQQDLYVKRVSALFFFELQLIIFLGVGDRAFFARRRSESVRRRKKSQRR